MIWSKDIYEQKVVGRYVLSVPKLEDYEWEI